MNTASSCSCSQGLAIDPSCSQHSTAASRTLFTRTNSDQSDSSVYQNTISDTSSATTPTYSTSRPTSSSSFDRRLSSGRGPRCPRHAYSDMTDCSCLVTPSLEESENDRRKSASTETSISPSRVRTRSVADPLTLLPRSSWSLYKDLVDNETAHIQLANELATLRLSQGCELSPSIGYGYRPDTDETFASGVLRPIRSVVNKFYFSEGGSGPVPRYAVEAPADVETRNVVVFFEKVHVDDEVDESHSKRRISAWATMWRDHVRGMMATGGGQTETCAPVPVIEVRQSGRFYLYFVVDTGSEALVLDRRIIIGDTNSMQGLCRLRNASVYLSSWKREVYMPWIRNVTERARVTIKIEPDL